MLLTLVPLFDSELTVKAYSVFAQKENQFLNPFNHTTGLYDGATYVEGIEAVNTMGFETLADDRPVFVQVTNVSIFSDIEGNCPKERDRVAILIDRTIPPVPMYVERLRELKKAGFQLAIRKLPVSEFQVYSPVLALMDYVFLNNKKIAIDKAKVYFSRLFPDIKLVAGNIDSMEEFEKLKAAGGYDFYEGPFYRIPASRGEHEITPVKATYIQLIKVVNNPDFELNDAADIISRDTALSLQLLQMVNRVVKMSEIKTIKHAAAMLGQKELKKWINAAAITQLYADNPGELTRLSLIRAKFAEGLAPLFGLESDAEELFLMGLFSIIDVVLEKPMEEAVDMIQLSTEIKDALVSKKGRLADVYEFMLSYEAADWTESSRIMIIDSIDVDKVYKAYLSSLDWYRQTIKG